MAAKAVSEEMAFSGSVMELREQAMEPDELLFEVEEVLELDLSMRTYFQYSAD